MNVISKCTPANFRKKPQIQGSKHGHVTKKTHSSVNVVSLFPNTAHFW